MYLTSLHSKHAYYMQHKTIINDQFTLYQPYRCLQYIVYTVCDIVEQSTPLHHPCYMLPYCPVPHCPPLRYGAALSSIAMSALTISMVSRCLVPRFQSPQTECNCSVSFLLIFRNECTNRQQWQSELGKRTRFRFVMVPSSVSLSVRLSVTLCFVALRVVVEG